MGKEIYSLDGVEQSVQEISEYVIGLLKKNKLSNSDIESYLDEIKNLDISGVITVSQEYLDMLNTMNDSTKQPEVKVSYLW